MSFRRLEFLIAGMQKAGTSALFRFLADHPGIFLPKSKELHFFDAEFRNWDAMTYAWLHHHFGNRAKGQISGEGTPIYTYWPTAAARIHAYNPDIKLIILLRHPIERAYSHWRMERGRGEEPLAFADAIRAGRRRVGMSGEMPGVHRKYSYVDRGLYAAQIERMLALFPLEQMLFLRTEDLLQSHEATLARVCDFLGVPHFDNAPAARRIDPVKILPEAPMAQTDRDHLMDIYYADIVRTAALTGLDLSEWLRLA